MHICGFVCKWVQVWRVANVEECVHMGVEVSLTLGDLLNNCPLY